MIPPSKVPMDSGCYHTYVDAEVIHGLILYSHVTSLYVLYSYSYMNNRVYLLGGNLRQQSIQMFPMWQPDPKWEKETATNTLEERECNSAPRLIGPELTC